MRRALKWFATPSCSELHFSGIDATAMVTMIYLSVLYAAVGSVSLAVDLFTTWIPTSENGPTVLDSCPVCLFTCSSVDHILDLADLCLYDRCRFLPCQTAVMTTDGNVIFTWFRRDNNVIRT